MRSCVGAPIRSSTHSSVLARRGGGIKGGGRRSLGHYTGQAFAALERIRNGEELTIPLEDVLKRHGMEG